MEGANNLAGDLLNQTQRNYWRSRRATRSRNYTMSYESVADYIVLDFETTGFRVGADRIIQIGAIKYENHKQIDLFNVFINPQRYIPPNITQLTGISNEMAKTAPIIEEVIEELIEFIGDLPIVAHNASFDMGFLYALENNPGIQIPRYRVIDTFRLARKRIQSTPDHKLKTLSEYLQIEHNAHDAIGDCQATAAIYQFCTK